MWGLNTLVLLGIEFVLCLINVTVTLYIWEATPSDAELNPRVIKELANAGLLISLGILMDW